MRSALSSNSRKTSELVMGAIAAAAMPSPARKAMSSPAVETSDDAQAQQAEHGQADQQHASASEAVGHRSGGEQQAAERQRVRAGDPLQRGRAAPEVATDRRQRDRQQRVVDHLDEERQAEGGQRDPRRTQGRVGTRRGARHRTRGHRMLARAVMSLPWPQHRQSRSHHGHTPLTWRSQPSETANGAERRDARGCHTPTRQAPRHRGRVACRAHCSAAQDARHRDRDA